MGVQDQTPALNLFKMAYLDLQLNANLYSNVLDMCYDSWKSGADEI